MKINYKGFEIEAKRERSLGGWNEIYYTVIHKKDGWFLADSYSEGEDAIIDFVGDLKILVDDYYENPSDYKECRFGVLNKK